MPSARVLIIALEWLKRGILAHQATVKAAYLVFSYPFCKWHRIQRSISMSITAVGYPWGDLAEDQLLEWVNQAQIVAAMSSKDIAPLRLGCFLVVAHIPKRCFACWSSRYSRCSADLSRGLICLMSTNLVAKLAFSVHSSCTIASYACTSIMHENIHGQAFESGAIWQVWSLKTQHTWPGLIAIRMSLQRSLLKLQLRLTSMTSVLYQPLLGRSSMSNFASSWS